MDFVRAFDERPNACAVPIQTLISPAKIESIDPEVHVWKQSRHKTGFFISLLRPDATLNEICAFVGVDFQPNMVTGSGFEVVPYTSGQHALVGQAPDADRMRAWENELRPRQIEILENIAGTLLTALGYDLKHGLQAHGMSIAEHVIQTFQDVYQRVFLNRILKHRRIRRSIKQVQRRRHLVVSD